jgi:Outer membrane protein beta-barrel family/Carboxypeptidase regulatory-like domain
MKKQIGMKHVYLLIVLSFTGLVSYSQKSGSLKGVVYDTLGKTPVASATITVLTKKDSSLVSFTMTDNQGRFELTGLANGEYRLLITHVNYRSASTFFTIDDTHKQVNLGNVVVNDVNRVLDAVVVEAEAPPVTLLDDTIQYNAGSFKVQPNANVEQLLKKMPGIKVEKDGTVKAQGQEVKKVLVDGKEFFGSDPKVATKNLPADAVDKVQVYDKKSDQAQLTGFDDGNSETTINLKLKKDKKKGLFGKVTGGAGTNDRYEGRFNVNSFKGARQLSVIGMANNTNAEGFSFMDMLNFSGELSKLKQGGGGTINLTITDPGLMPGGGNNNNIRTIYGGGVNYNNIIGSKTEFTSNYMFNSYNPKTENNIERQYFLPDSSYFYNQHSITDNLSRSHRVNLSADIQLDSFNSIKISPSFGYQQSHNTSLTQYQNLSRDKQQKGSEEYSDNTSNSDGYNFRNDLLYRKKFRRKGRTLSFSLQTSLNSTDGDGSIESVSKFYKGAPPYRTDSVKQHNTIGADLRSYNARIAYTEPIFNRSLLEISGARSNTHSTSEKITYDFNNLNGKFDQLNDLLTNDFENTYSYTTAGLRVRTQQKKFNFTAGVNWQQAELEGKIVSGVKDSLISKAFNNLLPNARFQYNFNRYRSLTLNYSAGTNQPSMQQLQPVPDISNPFNISIGNPDLKQEYSHTMQINFRSINPFKNKNLFAFFTLRQTQNKIVNYDSIDAVGVKTTRPVNVNSVFTSNGDINLGFPVRFLKGSINFGSRVSYNTGKQFINKISNNIKTFSFGPDVRLDMNATNKFNVSVSAGMNYYKTTYSLQQALNTTYFSQEYGLNADWELPKGFYLSSEFTYTINNRRADGFNTNVPLWNSSISKQFLRFNRGELKLTVFDLLNENINISRNTNQNYIEDSRTVTLQRYFMLTFTYSLSKTGLVTKTDGGNFRIIR